MESGPVGYSNMTRGDCNDIRRDLNERKPYKLDHAPQNRIIKGKYFSRQHQYMSEWMGGKYIRKLLNRVTDSTPQQQASIARQEKQRRSQTPAPPGHEMSSRVSFQLRASKISKRSSQCSFADDLSTTEVLHKTQNNLSKALGADTNVDLKTGPLLLTKSRSHVPSPEYFVKKTSSHHM